MILQASRLIFHKYSESWSEGLCKRGEGPAFSSGTFIANDGRAKTAGEITPVVDQTFAPGANDVTAAEVAMHLRPQITQILIYTTGRRSVKYINTIFIAMKPCKATKLKGYY